MNKTAQVLAALRSRFGSPSYAFLEQVRNSTGFATEPRTADAIAMGLWPSRGLHLHGFEVKVSRADWLRELKDPSKAEEIASRCHFWWIAAPAGIVQPLELPIGWGLLELAGAKMVLGKQAPIREPEAPSWMFIAAMLRRVATASEEALERRFRDGIETGKKDAVVDHTDHVEALRLFADASDGENFHKHTAAELGRAVRDYRNIDRRDEVSWLRKRLEGLRAGAIDLANTAGVHLDKLNEIKPENRTEGEHATP